MATMATLVAPNTNCLKRKASEDLLVLSKRFMLEPDEDSYSGESEIESIRSLQNVDTATARDTSDTDEDHEYEVQSLSEVTLSELSSGPENCVLIGNFNKIIEEFGSEISYVADLSDTFSSDDDEIGSLSHKKCEKCKGECEERFTLCLKCFRQKRVYCPPRPKGRRRKNRGSSPKRGDSDLAPSGQGSQGSSQGDDLPIEASQGSSQESSKICKCCFQNPIDGAFIHKNSVHSLYCYKCSVKQWRMRGRCPFCNQKLCKVAKIFPVEDE